jgi:glutathione synthase/RimK-type ligase-like ATP-grasp enzyme
MGYERNLILVHTLHAQARSEYEAIRGKIASRADDIEVFIVNNKMPNSVSRRQAARRPTLVFSPIALQEFKPARGKVYAGRRHTKMEEVQRLVAGDIRVPEARMLEQDTRLDPNAWGAFTVLKPNRGMGGNGVRLARTRDVHWQDPLSWPPSDPRFGVPLVAQRFIDTGPHTTCHRVTLLFGRPIWATTSRWLNARSFDLDADSAAPFDQAIAANHGERTVTLNYDEEILKFRASIAAAFPEIPVLGIDVIREAETGLLFALEVNAGGLTWHSSSDLGIQLQRDRAIDFHAQFGALDIIADALIDVTRREAE